jgi:hypothetical protein
MQLQTRNTTVSLAFLGPEWQDCALTFRAMRFTDLAHFDANDTTGAMILTLLKNRFVSGKALASDGSVQDVIADDLDQFDIAAIGEISRQVSETPDPKASPSSTDSSTPESQPLGAISA